MMTTLAFFPVGNGDMTLIELESGRTILIDMNIRAAADDPNDPTPDVAGLLRKRLKRDRQGRLYLDALLISHPHQDHCAGLQEHFHLGPPGEWSTKTDKILVREIWSSPMVFRRASRDNVLCEDAQAFNSEARRRVKRFRDSRGAVGDGDRILILGEDEDGKTDDVGPILIKVDEVFSRVNGEYDWSISARLLAPLPRSDDEGEEEVLAKNESSTILQFSFTGASNPDKGRFLSGGDAEVAIWERLWQRHWTQPDRLSYDILQAPHHCSWHSLSYDSWSELGEDAEVCSDARSALAQARPGAVIVASSEPIKDDDNDPPCIRAKREYEAIVANVRGSFKCVGESPSEDAPEVMEFEIGQYGPRPKTKLMKAAAVLGTGVVGRQPLPHG
ncbi:F39 [uncultured Defluviicoccus sp.]|uniref:F39 n=1 Tax=metagenome TaxID=256318 RepID=A0A380TJ63_9ZZZZ|nr:F39 [uncultured Defluviicoccus sp.]